MQMPDHVTKEAGKNQGHGAKFHWTLCPHRSTSTYFAVGEKVSCLLIFSSTMQTLWMYLFFHLFCKKSCRNTAPSHIHVWYYQMIRVKFTYLIFLDCLFKRSILINSHIIIQQSSSTFTLNDLKICMIIFLQKFIF